MSKLADSLAGAALRLAEMEWFVLALLEDGKAPAITRGVKNATRDPVQIEHWWRRRDFNVGIATGAVSGICVIDIDSPQIVETLIRAACAHGGLPRTVMSRTPRGYHLYFGYVPGIRNRIRVPELNIDVRSDGGYVVAPPSRLSVDQRYLWVRSPWTTRVAEMPEWLSARLRNAVPSPCRASTRPLSIGGPARYGRSALKREARQLSQAPVGTRNHALNVSAFRMGTLIEACGLSEAEIGSQLVAACEVNGLISDDGPHAVERTLASGLRAGQKNPRRLPEAAE
jgi:hypothetical protein